MDYLLMFLYLFLIGSIIGWFIELFYRRYFSTKKWINPGFLSGPYLPLYGFGVAIIYFICLIDVSWWIQAIIVAILMTVIELIAGLIFISFMKIKLWDYSNEKFNYKGIISLKYSIFWGLLGVFFIFIVYPPFNTMITYLLSNGALLLPLGVFYGLIISDFGHSIDLAVKIREIAVTTKHLISFENLKKHIARNEKASEGKRSFLFAFRSKKSIKENASKYVDSLNEN